MESPVVFNEDYWLWALLTQARYSMFRVREKELREDGISPEQAGVLVIVCSLGKNATPSEISRWLLRRPNTISTIVERMIKKGLVRKKIHSKRKNMVRVVLTKKGRELESKIRGYNSINEMMSPLSKEDKEQLKSYLQTLRDKAFKILNLVDRPVFPTYR